MKKDVYVYTGKEGPAVRTEKFNRGGVFVAVDFNHDREVIGVEVIDATAATVDGEKLFGKTV